MPPEKHPKRIEIMGLGTGNTKDASIERSRNPQESRSATRALYEKSVMSGCDREANKRKYQRCRIMHLLKIKTPISDSQQVGL